MARPSLDPKGYYAVLGLTPAADTAAVKRAYRTRAKVLHPDRNPSPRAAEEFHALAEAYGVLRDAETRRAYDSGRLGARGPGGSTGGTARGGRAANPTPLGLRTCEVCGRTTLDLRYRVLHRVRGQGFKVVRAPIAGVFCRLHGERTVVAASLYCWALGWWALPWGPVATVAALARNLPGGDLPPTENYQLLTAQARAFLARGNLPIARRLVEQARRFARTPAERAHIAQLLETLAEQPAPRRPDRVRWFGPAQMAQIAPLLLMVTLAVYIVGPGRLIAPLLNRAADPTPIVRDQGPVSGRTQPAPTTQGPFTGQTEALPETGGRGGGSRPEVLGAGVLHAVQVESVTVRQAPSRNAPVVATLPRATVVTVLSVSADGGWSRILSARGVRGFVVSEALRPLATGAPRGP
ncbi:DnaJ domain-containing protein [Roseospira marina]|uniref:DnaJ domain-containing protein n=1 Tax=Roseospira marina TaxID=140057 RepID=A0A5M6IFV6_9PROT|nr:DnaJ domain-containing protein [Roseospira marina]KAA5606468.1 DnaJ domain-containing protein [Roseospira marina]MBB4314112.1 hypothetical protein [Roseospira marina]MBB5087273.1 hypothetical protein [Roseospira marina]